MRSSSGLALPEDSPVPALARAVREAGGRLWVVGGWVRDRLRGDTDAGGDLDLEVYGLDAAACEQLLSHYGRVRRIGRSFPILRASGIDADVSLPRRESARGSLDAAEPALDFADAARRRDLTVNSIGWDPLADELLDPLGGAADLEAGVLRASDAARFGDDPLRGLRVATFRAALDLEPDAALRDLCAALDLAALPAERVFHELSKLLFTKHPSRGLAFLRETGLLRFLPALAATVDVPQDPVWHPVVQVDVRDVRPEVGRPHEPEQRVQVRSVHVHLPALLVDDAADLADGRLEDPVRRGVGHHERGEPAPRRLCLGPQVLDVHVAVAVAPDHDDPEPRHLRAGGVRAVRGGGDEAHVPPPLSPALVVAPDDEEPGVLALRSRVGLERHPRERGALAEHELQVPDELPIPLGLIGRSEGMDPREPLERHREHLGRRIQLHRARAERDHRAVQSDVAGREPPEIPQHLGLAPVAVEDRVAEDRVRAEHRGGEAGAGRGVEGFDGRQVRAGREPGQHVGDDAGGWWSRPRRSRSSGRRPRAG